MPDNPIETAAQAKSDSENFRLNALDYHENPRPGKLEVRATKPLTTQRDLALAYSPGVAEACLEIKADPSAAARYTARANLVAVVSNGSAALGLGNIGGLAAKPIMEGKAVLFKKFANIDCFDIEVDESDPERLAEIVRALEPTFGAINLEDIKAPDCFIVEDRCRKSMNIPVFHDDQHGTAIVVGAASVNALTLSSKKFEDVKVVSTGGGAAGIACLNMLIKLGVRRQNIWLCDIAGLVYEGRTEEMTPQKAAFAQPSPLRTLGEVIDGADLFLGLSGGGVLKPEMVAKMAPDPVVLALANPTPEIWPADAQKARPDAIIATGRSDYPNQVNNVLCFPFIFRGALDVGATEINDSMELACVRALADLARAPVAAEAARAYSGETLVFSRDYLIPKPFDPRLLAEVAGAVAEAAMTSGAATRPLEDPAAYRAELNRFVYRSGFLMKPIFARARGTGRKVVFAEGEDERVLQAANAMIEEGLAAPVLVGRPRVIETRAKRLGLPILSGDVLEICNPEDDPRYNDYWRTYHQLQARDGVSPDLARAILRTNSTAIAAVMVRRGEADAMICGAFGDYDWHLKYVSQVLGEEGGAGRHPIGAMTVMIVDRGPIFIADTHVHDDPSPEQIVDITLAAASGLGQFGIEPRVALISQSTFGSRPSPGGKKMRQAVRLLDAAKAEGRVAFEYEGEMPMDVALDTELRTRLFPEARLTGPTNLVVMPTLEAANATKNALKALSNGLQVGPILLGFDYTAHIVTPSVTARGVLNVAALAAAGGA